ncbi:glycosyltransferase family 4 protein [Flavobacterium ardleyense]|uniref:Glycosyltransferase family 4 protein n=1 Tax=Flavobacterium ardleyense TaxID=2038737 RepID=A0ABW5Z8G4_9FLAO
MKTNQIKIFIDCHVFDGKPQGTTTYLKGIYSEVLKNRSIILFLASFNPEKLKNEFGENENINYLKYPSKNKFKRLLIDIPLLIKKHKIDYAHFQYIVPPIKNCKFIVTIHDVLFIDFPHFFPLLYKLKNFPLFYLSAKRSDYVVTVSKYSKDKIEEHFHLKNILITPNAVDNEFFDDYSKEVEEKHVQNKFNCKEYFLFVSRREPRKNHLNLLKSFVACNYFDNYKLVCIGSKDIKDKAFDKYYDSLSAEVKNKVVFLENLNFADLLAITRAAKIAIYPSFAEGFGIPPLESIAANIPTICSNKTAMSDFEFMQEFLFDPNSVEEISNKIKYALNVELTNNLREIVKKRYSWVSSADVLTTIFLSKNNL